MVQRQHPMAASHIRQRQCGCRTSAHGREDSAHPRSRSSKARSTVSSRPPVTSLRYRAIKGMVLSSSSSRTALSACCRPIDSSFASVSIMSISVHPLRVLCFHYTTVCPVMKTKRCKFIIRFVDFSVLFCFCIVLVFPFCIISSYLYKI